VLTTDRLKAERAGTLPHGTAAVIMVSTNVCFVLVASFCVVFGEPAVAGSGIPGWYLFLRLEYPFTYRPASRDQGDAERGL
jgi:hypothetical protein